MPRDTRPSHSTSSERRVDSYSDESSSGVQVQSPSAESQEYTDSASAEDEGEGDWDFVDPPAAPYPEDDIEPDESASRPRTTRHWSATQPRPEPVRRKSSHRIPPVRDPPLPRRATQGEGHYREHRQPRDRGRRPPSDPSSVESHDYYDGRGCAPAPAPPHHHPTPQWAHVPQHQHPAGYPPSLISHGNPFTPDAMVPYPRHHDPYGYHPNPFSPGLQGHANPFTPAGTTASHETGYFAQRPHAPPRNPRHSMPAVGGHEMIAMSPGPYYPGAYPPYGMPYPYGYPPPHAHSPAPSATRGAPAEPAAAAPAAAPAPATPAEPPKPSAADEQIAKMMAMLMANQDREQAKAAAEKEAADAAFRKAEEAKKKAEEDKLKKVHDLLIEQQKQALAREKQMLETDKAIEAALKAKDEQDAAAKKAAEAEAAKLAEVAKKAREDAEAEAAKKLAEAKDAADKAVAEAKKATEEAEAARKKAEEEAAKLKPADDQPPIKFKDAVGRTFRFPFHLCKTWKGMESLIKQAFMHVDVIGPHVAEGHYDLIGPNNEIILPQIWDTIIQPDWNITMMMWPMPEDDAAKEPPGGPPPPSGMPMGLGGPIPPDYVHIVRPGKDKKSKDKKGAKAKAGTPAAMAGMMPGPPPPPPIIPPGLGIGGMMPPPPPPPGVTVVDVGPGGAAAAAATAVLAGEMRPGHKARSKSGSKPSGFLRWTAGAGRSQSLKRGKKA